MPTLLGDNFTNTSATRSLPFDDPQGPRSRSAVQTTNNQQPTTNNKQQTTNNKQPTTNNQQPTTNNQQPTTKSI